MAHEMPILLCKRLVRFCSSAEDYKEPVGTFKKVIGDKVGFKDYILKKLLLAIFNVSKTEVTLNSRGNLR